MSQPKDLNNFTSVDIGKRGIRLEQSDRHTEDIVFISHSEFDKLKKIVRDYRKQEKK